MSEIERALDVLYSPPTHSALPTVRWVQPVSLSNPEPWRAARRHGVNCGGSAALFVGRLHARDSVVGERRAVGAQALRRRAEGRRSAATSGRVVKHEDQIILSGVRCYGLKWSKIVGLLLAAEYPARTDDAVRNRWQRLVRKQQAVAAARAEAELEAADVGRARAPTRRPPPTSRRAPRRSRRRRSTTRPR